MVGGPGPGPYGPIWAHMGPYGPLWVLMGPKGPCMNRPSVDLPCSSTRFDLRCYSKKSWLQVLSVAIGRVFLFGDPSGDTCSLGDVSVSTGPRLAVLFTAVLEAPCKEHFHNQEPTKQPHVAITIQGIIRQTGCEACVFGLQHFGWTMDRG